MPPQSHYAAAKLRCSILNAEVRSGSDTCLERLRVRIFHSVEGVVNSFDCFRTDIIFAHEFDDLIFALRNEDDKVVGDSAESGSVARSEGNGEVGELFHNHGRNAADFFEIRTADIFIFGHKAAARSSTRNGIERSTGAESDNVVCTAAVEHTYIFSELSIGVEGESSDVKRSAGKDRCAEHFADNDFVLCDDHSRIDTSGSKAPVVTVGKQTDEVNRSAEGVHLRSESDGFLYERRHVGNVALIVAFLNNGQRFGVDFVSSARTGFNRFDFGDSRDLGVIVANHHFGDGANFDRVEDIYESGVVGREKHFGLVGYGHARFGSGVFNHSGFYFLVLGLIISGVHHVHFYQLRIFTSASVSCEVRKLVNDKIETFVNRVHYTDFFVSHYVVPPYLILAQLLCNANIDVCEVAAVVAAERQIVGADDFEVVAYAGRICADRTSISTICGDYELANVGSRGGSGAAADGIDRNKELKVSVKEHHGDGFALRISVLRVVGLTFGTTTITESFKAAVDNHSKVSAAETCGSGLGSRENFVVARNVGVETIDENELTGFKPARRSGNFCDMVAGNARGYTITYIVCHNVLFSFCVIDLVE